MRRLVRRPLGAYRFGALSGAITEPETSSAGDPFAGLSRVPWEGGPAYYASFPQAVASGMTSDTFFPIAVDFESVTTQANVDADKGYGANMYIRITSDSSMSLIRSNGMIAMPQQNMAGKGNETVGWTIDDELDVSGPQGWATGATFDNAHNSWAANQVYAAGDGRMLYSNFSKPVAFNENDNKSRVYVNGTTKTSSPDRLPGATDGRPFSWDMTSLDCYFYTVFLSAFDKGNLAGIGCPNNLIRRGINYGKFGVDRIRQRQAMESPTNYQPVYSFIEVTNQMTASESAAEGIPVTDPTNNQIAGAVWGSLVYEARGIIYFIHDFNHGGGAHNLRDNINGRTPGVTTLNAQVKAHAPVLNTQSYVWTFNSTVKTMLKNYGGFAWIFAMSDAQAPHDTTARTFTLPSGFPQSGTITVVDEARTITISGGTFSDSFAAEYTYHIYKVPLP